MCFQFYFLFFLFVFFIFFVVDLDFFLFVFLLDAFLFFVFFDCFLRCFLDFPLRAPPAFAVAPAGDVMVDAAAVGADDDADVVVDYSTYADEDGNGKQIIYVNESLINDTLNIIARINNNINKEIKIIIHPSCYPNLCDGNGNWY